MLRTLQNDGVVENFHHFAEFFQKIMKKITETQTWSLGVGLTGLFMGGGGGPFYEPSREEGPAKVQKLKIFEFFLIFGPFGPFSEVLFLPQTQIPRFGPKTAAKRQTKIFLYRPNAF